MAPISIQKLMLSLISLSLLCVLGSVSGKTPKSSRDITLPVKTDCDQTGYLTGDWGGYRCDLLDSGVDLEGSYTMDYLGNLLGGESRGFNYADAFDLSANFDLEKLLNWSGAEFFISAIQGDGQNLGVKRVGSVFTPMQVYTNSGFTVDNIYLKQSLFEASSFFKIGRIDAGDDFITHPIYQQFVSGGINANPIAVFFNTPFSIDPNTEWGLYGQNQTGRFVSKLGAYNTVGDVNQSKYHGVQFSFNNDNGVLLDVEEDYVVSNNSLDLPAEYSLGALWVTGENQTNYQTGQKASGNYGGYIQLVQQFTRPNGLFTTQGLSGFATVLLFPTDRNMFPFYGEMGLTDEGLIQNRPLDTLGVAYLYGKFGSDYANYQVGLGNLRQSYESAFELNYKIQMTSWGYLEPDFQWVQNPGGADQYHDAWVAGLQGGVVF